MATALKDTRIRLSDPKLFREQIERFGLRDLVDEAPIGQNLKEFGLVGTHGLSSH